MIETIKSERKLLKQIIVLSDNNGEVLLERLGKTNKSYLIQLLTTSSLVELSNYDSWDKNPRSVKLTPQGRLFFEGRHEEFSQFILKSIIIPIITSLSVTAILWFIGYMTGAIS